MMADVRSKYLDVMAGTVSPDDFDGVRLGSETCPQLLPSVKDIEEWAVHREPGLLSLVTPVAGPDEIDVVMRVIEAAVFHGWGEVVVNDWGVLKAAATKSAGLTAGRLLMRFRRGPGSSHQETQADQSVKRYFAWGPLYDTPFLAFLENNGVNRIETDIPRQWLPLPDLDRLRISLHRDTRLVSVSGVCPWIYSEKPGIRKPVSGCERPCAVKGEVVMTAPELDGQLFLRERAIIERVDADIESLDLPVTVDRIIYAGGRNRV